MVPTGSRIWIFKDETWDIKWSLIESAMILFALTKFFLYFSLSSSPTGSANYFSMNPSISLSSRMRITLYFHAHNLSSPSIFSSILVLDVFFPQDLEIWQKLKICINELWTYQWVLYSKATSFLQESSSTHPLDVRHLDLGFYEETLIFQFHNFGDLIQEKMCHP